VAIQLRSMDAEVVAISRLLAVGALQVRADTTAMTTMTGTCLHPHMAGQGQSD